MKLYVQHVMVRGADGVAAFGDVQSAEIEGGDELQLTQRELGL